MMSKRAQFFDLLSYITGGLGKDETSGMWSGKFPLKISYLNWKEAYIKICSKLLQGQQLQSADVRTDLEFSQDKECQCRWKLEMVVEYWRER